MRQKHPVRYSIRFPFISMLTSRYRNPTFSPSDRNTFFLFVRPESPDVTISFFDHDSIGEPEEIGHAIISFHRLLDSGDSFPSDIISLPIVIQKPKTARIRGQVDLRYGLVCRSPPLPAAELLARATPRQLPPFSSFLQRMVRFLQVLKLLHRVYTTLSFLDCAPSIHTFLSQKYNHQSLIHVHKDAWESFIDNRQEEKMQSLVQLWGPEP
jgi:hypothetical protein